MRFATFVLLLVATQAAAHDYWLEPATAADGVAIRLFVGHRLADAEEKPFQRDRCERFQLVSPKDTSDLMPKAADRARPLLTLAGLATGTHVVRLDRAATTITLDPANFHDYLREEGLTAVIADRTKRGEADKPGRERYRRCLKALVTVGGDRTGAWDKPAGQALELVPEAFPAANAAFPVRVLLDGQPLAAVKVDLLHRDPAGTVTTKSVTADAAGRAAFALAGRGVYVARLVHMRRAANDADAEWASVWAALTVSVP